MHLRTNQRATPGLLAALSGALFIAAVASALWLQTLGIYVSLTLVVFGGFCMLISAMIGEKVKPVAEAKAQELDDEEEALLN